MGYFTRIILKIKTTLDHWSSLQPSPSEAHRVPIQVYTLPFPALFQDKLSWRTEKRPWVYLASSYLCPNSLPTIPTQPWNNGPRPQKGVPCTLDPPSLCTSLSLLTATWSFIHLSRYIHLKGPFVVRCHSVSKATRSSSSGLPCHQLVSVGALITLLKLSCLCITVSPHLHQICTLKP